MVEIIPVKLMVKQVPKAKDLSKTAKKKAKGKK